MNNEFQRKYQWIVIKLIINGKIFSLVFILSFVTTAILIIEMLKHKTSVLYVLLACKYFAYMNVWTQSHLNTVLALFFSTLHSDLKSDSENVVDIVK